MQSTFIRELITTLIGDTTLTTKRDYQKTKNLLLSKYGTSVEDVGAIEVLEDYRNGINDTSLIYNPRVWKMLRKR